MKRICTFLFLFILVPAAWARHVPQQDAQQIAMTFYRLNNPSGVKEPEVKSATVKTQNEVPSLYIFRFVSGGFVIVAADDASIPILGYSFENEFPEIIENPSKLYLLDNYSHEIAYIVRNKLDNTETLKEWSSIQKDQPLSPAQDVGPLLTTLWDQVCNYNALCPPDTAGPCSHTLTGCVATAMAQIMKYHNFPPQGVGQHSYIDGTYGPLFADFGNTTYNWMAMPNTATSGSMAVDTLMNHAGIALDMGYSAYYSGSYLEKLPDAFLNYFNYNPEIEVKYKDSFANVEDFKTMLRADLDSNLPIEYGGYGPYGGHAFVCDGYRMSDDKFHFNWGWSGTYNGYYTINNLNPGGYTWNSGQIAIVHIKPYNPNLITRITKPADKEMVAAGSSVEIKANTVRGASNQMKIFIDEVQKLSFTGDSITFTWSTSSADLGSHVVKAYSMNASDTVYNKILINIVNENEWTPQSSGFSSPKAINYLSAVDSNIIWATSSNPGNLSIPSSDFTRTTNGGATWIPGQIANTAGLLPSMIFGLTSLKAYVAMAKVSGSNAAGIYMTSDGGSSWARQVSAFNNAYSSPDIVHFFNANDGVCIGNPVNGGYEIYTTTNGGSNWVKVPAANIPYPVANDVGFGGGYSAVQDTIWFGTYLGRVYRSADKGLHWSVSSPGGVMNGKLVKPVFRDGSHGLILDEQSGAGFLFETSNGGINWTPINYSGPNYSGDLAYVPGTKNTWVKSNFLTWPRGIAYSYDGGDTWMDFVGTKGSQFGQMAWVNNHCGWSGGINTSPTEFGLHKFIGLLQSALLPPQDVHAVPNAHQVEINWSIPAYDPSEMTLLGYNVKRNGTKINVDLVTDQAFIDQNVPSGLYTYCISAHYDLGNSPDNCKSVGVALGIKQPDDESMVLVYPNPAHDKVIVKTAFMVTEILIYNQSGDLMPVVVKRLQPDLATIDISGLSTGLYLVVVKSAEGKVRHKLIVY